MASDRMLSQTTAGLLEHISALSWNHPGSPQTVSVVARVGPIGVGEGAQQGVVVRAGGTPANMRGIVATLERNNPLVCQLQLNPYLNGERTNNFSGNFVAGSHWVWLRIVVEGTRVRARAWQDGIAEPKDWLLDKDWAGSIPEDGGWVGVVARNQANCSYFDVSTPDEGEVQRWTTDFSEYVVDEQPDEWVGRWGSITGNPQGVWIIKGLGGAPPPPIPPTPPPPPPSMPPGGFIGQYRPISSSDWLPLFTGVKGKAWEWDVTEIPAGSYLIRVGAVNADGADVLIPGVRWSQPRLVQIGEILYRGMIKRPGSSEYETLFVNGVPPYYWPSTPEPYGEYKLIVQPHDVLDPNIPLTDPSAERTVYLVAVPEKPTLVVAGIRFTECILIGSDFRSEEEVAHGATRWLVALAGDPDFDNPIFDSGWDTENLTRLEVNGLPEETLLIAAVQYRDERGVESQRSDSVTFWTIPLPPRTMEEESGLMPERRLIVSDIRVGGT